jgi:hypothetical protein
VTLARRRVTTREASETLGVSVEAVRKRIERGKIDHEREANRVYVYLDDDQIESGHNAEGEETNGLLEALREQVAYLQGVIATRDRELATRAEEISRRDEEIRRRDAALEREQHLAAGFAERLRALGAPAEGEAGGTHQDGPPAADTPLKEELEEALRGDARLASLTPLYYAALPFMFGAGIAAGIANPLLIANTNNALWSTLYLLWTIPPIFGYWLGQRVALLRDNAWEVANGLETIRKNYTGTSLADADDADNNAFDNLMIRFDIADYLIPPTPNVPNDDSPHQVKEVYPSLDDIRNKLAVANARPNVLENLFSVFSVGVGVVTLFSSLGTFWFVTDPGETSEALRQMVGMAIVQGIFAAMFVLFAAFIVLGRARQKREEAHPPSRGGLPPRLLSGNLQALIGLVGASLTAIVGLVGVLIQVFYGGGGGG